MAPPDDTDPYEPDAFAGLTQGHTADDSAADSGEADFVTSTRDTRENERPPIAPKDKR